MPGLLQVSPRFAELVRTHELSQCPPARRAEVGERLDDALLRPLLDEQLRECVTAIAMLATPAGAALVGADGRLGPLAASHVFEAIPVLPTNRPEAEALASAEFHRLATTPQPAPMPGARLELGRGREIRIFPTSTKVFGYGG